MSSASLNLWKVVNPIVLLVRSIPLLPLDSSPALKGNSWGTAIVLTYASSSSSALPPVI